MQIALVMLLALFLRLLGLSRGVWLDEFSSIEVITAPNFLVALREYDHPPLYFALLKLWALFGLEPFVLRLFSVLVSVASVPVVMCWLRSHSRRAAMIAGLSCAVLPSLLIYSQEIRHYSLLLFFAALCFYFLSQFISREPPDHFPYRFSFAVCLAVSTHFIAIMLIPAFFILVFLARKENVLPLIRSVALGIIPPILLFVFWYKIFLVDLSHTSAEAWWMPDVSALLVGSVFFEVVGLTSFLSLKPVALWLSVPLASVWPLVGLGLIGVVFAQLFPVRISKGAIYFLSATTYLATLAVFSLISTPVLLARTALPFAFPFIAGFAIQLSDLQRTLGRNVTYVAVSIFAVIGVANWCFVDAWKNRENWPQVRDILLVESTQADTIVVEQQFIKGIVQHYLRDMRVVFSEKERHEFSEPNGDLFLISYDPKLSRDYSRSEQVEGELLYRDNLLTLRRIAQ